MTDLATRRRTATLQAAIRFARVTAEHARSAERREQATARLAELMDDAAAAGIPASVEITPDMARALGALGARR